MILNPAYKGAANTYLETGDDIYDQVHPEWIGQSDRVHPEWIAQNVCPSYQDEPNRPATFSEPTAQKEPYEENGSSRMKAKICVAAILPTAVLSTVMALLTVIIVAMLYTTTGSHNQEILSIQMELETLREILAHRK